MEDKDLTRLQLESFEKLVAEVQNEDSSIRYRVVQALATSEDKRAFDLLIKILLNTTEKDWIRCNVVHILAKCNSDTVLEPLLTTLKDKNSLVRSCTAAALGDLGDKRAISPLKEALNDLDFSVWVEAAGALYKLGQEEFFDLIVFPLTDNDDYVRYTAANVLANLGSTRVVKFLLGLLSDEDDGIVEVAIYGLAKLGDKQAINELEKVREYYHHSELRFQNQIKEAAARAIKTIRETAS